ncbi:hypothetical protein N7528_008978 [Penicillium herquei]|nr:hypothetical protein N7528_008978 [Penicillium herquei]
MEQPEAPRVAFYKYLRAFYPFDSAGEVSPSTVILPLDQGDIILIHSTHTNGWADGTSLNSGNRGWLPTNYCEEYNQLPMRPLLKALTDFWDIIQRGCGSSLKDFGNQDLMRGPIAGVRFLLEKSECLTRDAPLVEKYESIRRIRKALLSNLSSLVKTAKQFYDTANGAPVENEVEMILDEMLLKAFKIITCGVRFLDVWNEEVGLTRTIEEMERAGIQFDMPPKPASATSSLADTAPIPETCTEQNESQQISHNHMDFSQMSIQTEALDQQSLPMSVSASHVSLSHQNPYSGPLLAIPTQSLASERLGASYDAFLGVLGGFIGIHNSLSSDELVTTTQQAVQSCQALLNVIDAVSKKDAQRGALLDEAREAMCERLSELDHAARDVFQPTNSPDNDLLFMPDEGKRLVDAATDCVRAAGNCLVKARLVLKQIGDIELDPVQEEATTNEDVPSVIASQASPDIPTDEEKPRELSPSLHPPSTHGLSEQIGDTELNPQSLESAISLDHSDDMDFVLTEPSLMDRNFSDTIGSVSQYASDQMFSAGQPSILDSQTALTAPTAPTAPTASGLEVDTDDLRTIYSDTLTMDTSDKEAYINELAHELFKAVSTFRLDSASMKRVADAMPGYLKAFSSRPGCTSPSQQDQRDVTVFIHKYRQ